MASSKDAGATRVVVTWTEPTVVHRLLSHHFEHVVWSDRSGGATDRVSFVGVAADGDVVVRRSTHAGFPEVATALRTHIVPGLAIPARLGWWGWFAYELGVASLEVDGPASDAPAAAFLFAGAGVEFHHDQRLARIVGLPGREGLIAELEVLLRGSTPVAGGSVETAAWAVRRTTRADYLDAIADCRRAITAGDAYQLCLTDRFTVGLQTGVDAGEVYSRVRRAYPVHHGGVIRIAGWTLISGSPEDFLAIDRSGLARSRPMKGTRPRAEDSAADARIVAALLGSEKERAENLMIVDLVRNDLARVAEVGSVEVPDLFSVETYPTVHQLVSTVQARLAVDPLDAVQALLPAGSMTGTPKRSAVRILADLERAPRGVYSGAWGRISVNGTVDLAVVIRSIVLHDEVATIGTGGGITMLSQPEEEWIETEIKAAPLLRALGATVAT